MVLCLEDDEIERKKGRGSCVVGSDGRWMTHPSGSVIRDDSYLSSSSRIQFCVFFWLLFQSFVSLSLVLASSKRVNYKHTF